LLASHRRPGTYDVLVTNPPYSKNHVERLFKFVAMNPEMPFLLLLPMYFYTESFFKTTIGAQSKVGNLFFICPGLGRRYGYTPPKWTDLQREESAPIAPFPSFWFCNAGPYTKPIVKKWKTVNEVKTNSRLEIFSQRVFLARTTGDLPNELKSEFDGAKKRANPKSRKKIAAKRQAMLGEGEVFVKKEPSKKAAEWRKKAQEQLKQSR